MRRGLLSNAPAPYVWIDSRVLVRDKEGRLASLFRAVGSFLSSPRIYAKGLCLDPIPLSWINRIEHNHLNFEIIVALSSLEGLSHAKFLIEAGCDIDSGLFTRLRTIPDEFTLRAIVRNNPTRAYVYALKAPLPFSLGGVETPYEHVAGKGIV